MARDALDVLVRLRDMAVTQASARLAAVRGEEVREARLLDAHRLEMQREQEGARAGDMSDLFVWLPHARAEEQRLLANLQAVAVRVERCQQDLLACRTDAEAVEQARARRKAAAALLLARREQAEMDEVAGRSRGGVWKTPAAEQPA